MGSGLMKDVPVFHPFGFAVCAALPADLDGLPLKEHLLSMFGIFSEAPGLSGVRSLLTGE